MAASIPTIIDVSKLTFIGTDGVINRRYYLNNDGTSILYSDDKGMQKVMYTAPKGAMVGLRFSPVNPGSTILCVNVYVSVSKLINGRTVLGALESSVYLRNHPLLHP